MAIGDLLASLDKTATVLEDTGWLGEAEILRDRKQALERLQASESGRSVGECVSEIKNLFDGMGSLNDIGAPIRDRVEGRDEKVATSTIMNQLDDLFLNCLFWNTKREEMQPKQERMMKAYRMVSDFLPPRHYYHIKPNWFRKWAD